MRVSPRHLWCVAVAVTLGALGTVGLDSMSARQRAPGLAVSVDARSMQPGELVVLTVVTPEPADGVTARAFGHRVATYRVDRATWRILVGIDLDTPAGRH